MSVLSPRKPAGILYVCGNGGMKPRHADLFATSLDKETLIKYIDRFLSFYVRTADRLQRTSVWMENMEGGAHIKTQKTVSVFNQVFLIQAGGTNPHDAASCRRCRARTDSSRFRGDNADILALCFGAFAGAAGHGEFDFMRGAQTPCSGSPVLSPGPRCLIDAVTAPGTADTGFNRA